MSSAEPLRWGRTGVCDVQGIAEGAGLVQALKGFRMAFQCGSLCDPVVGKSSAK